MEMVATEVLAWDFFAMTAASGRGWGKGAKQAPTAFENIQQYVRVFRPLLMEELRAHLLQVCMPHACVASTETGETCKCVPASIPGNRRKRHLRLGR